MKSDELSAVDIVDAVEAKTPRWSSTYGLSYGRSSSTDGIPSRGGETSNDAPSSLYDTGTDGAGTY